MTDDTHPQGSFREHVQRLVTEGKLTAEEAAHLLEGTDTPPAPPSNTIAQYVQAIEDGEAPGLNLNLEIEGYVLSVVQDSSVNAPTLSANREGELALTATPSGLRLKRVRHSDWSSLKAVLTLPFKPQHVQVEINGGSLSLGDIAGEMRAEVNGGNVTMSAASTLNAEVNGGNFTAGNIAGPTKMEVNGGNITVMHATTLDAEVNGGNLRWAGLLSGGTHRTEVNAGNATLTLLPGSSVRVDAEVTLGNFKAEFPTQKSGGFMEAHYTGQLGGGEALLRCEVSAGQIKLLTEPSS
ncbi:DUF4097 family beta strand repeat-containing protein [Deinococcus fonticola]|uniref:DUF4097 family beta strand repeat-containing protein n=1 Tax=Deinococcus fonticola TaxID=2528713 RepID=UPI001075435A|nr:DUF4097 family beta strand repeat-containing protein [Deinococcus fonticola]